MAWRSRNCGRVGLLPRKNFGFCAKLIIVDHSMLFFFFFFFFLLLRCTLLIFCFLSSLLPFSYDGRYDPVIWSDGIVEQDMWESSGVFGEFAAHHSAQNDTFFYDPTNDVCCAEFSPPLFLSHIGAMLAKSENEEHQDILVVRGITKERKELGWPIWF